MFSSHDFLLGGKHLPAFRHKAGGLMGKQLEIVQDS
jgi:hypothetical protein